MKIFRSFVVAGLALLASLSRGTTFIYPADAIDEFWNLNAEEFRAKYAGINVTGLGPSDEGWYVRYRHENLTCLFGPLAEREDARKRKWDLETVRDAAIRNRASLASSQVDFVRFTFSGIYGKGGGGGGGGSEVDKYPRISPDGKYGPDGDMNGNGIPNRLDPDMDGNGIPNEKDLDSDGDGIPNDKDDYPFGPHPSTWGKPGVAVDEHGHAIDGTGGGDGQGGDGKGGDGKDGKGGSGKAGAGNGGDQSGAIADASANGQGSGKDGKGGKGGKGGSQGGGSQAGDGSDGGGGQGGQGGQNGQNGQNGRQVASNQRGGSRGGQSGQGGQQGGQSGQSGGQQGGQQGSSGQSGGGQSGGGSSGGQPGGGGDSSPMSGGSSGGGGNPLSLIAGLLKKILGL